MNVRAAAIAVTATIALAALGAGPAFADNHAHSMDGDFQHADQQQQPAVDGVSGAQGPQYLQD
ncbi:hypothetical protein ACFXDJ_14805 [Streptomyces sp. NPDC059443]|uniref:hypothetical protein n=1 Tax=unclassified Streptomyces TaxID=2593676 RepID=UPI00368E5778